jgi:hypothetical protein
MGCCHLPRAAGTWSFANAFAETWRKARSVTLSARTAGDISNGGVRFTANGYVVPDEFVLLLSGDGPARDGAYRVIWRLGDEVGAKYIGSK